MPPDAKPIIFYDGACSLCRKEINHYIRLDTRKMIVWHDISASVSLLNAHNIDYEDAMRRLHGITSKGDIVIGVDAFLMLWAELPYFNYLSKGIKLIGLTRLLNPIYNRFSDWRYHKRSCSIPQNKQGAKNDPS